MKGASFEAGLPAQVVQQLQTRAILPIALLQDGSPLPDWLRFNAQTLKFTAQRVPTNVLPLQVMIVAGSLRILVEIIEMK